MAGKKVRILTCAKCGITSEEDFSVTFHRFPRPSVHGSLKPKVWAKFCYPDEDWSSDQSTNKLYKKYKMLCSKHFENASFTSNNRKRLNKFAIPMEAQHIMAQLRDEVLKPSLHTASETQMDLEVTASPAVTAQCSSISVEQSTSIINPQSPKLTKKSCTSGILKEIGANSLTELTPKKYKLYQRCRKNVSEILRLRKKFKNIKKCKRDILQSLHKDDAVNNVIKSKLSSPFYLLLQSQLKNGSKKLAGRRWSLDDKVLALSLYKKSSSCYRLLRRLFCLPSIGSLKALLNKIPMKCGINPQIFKTIEDITKKRPIQENVCVLAFDEMAIRKNLEYNSKQDQINGYQDHASQGRTAEIACKALTFMAIGTYKKWKMPIAFYFSGSCVTADRLSVLIKEVISACFRAGLEVIGIVCDCDGVNIRAINLLGSTTTQPYFEYDGHEIATILDPPHLLKCFRNNFIKHDIEVKQAVQIDDQKLTGVAKWDDIKKLFCLDKTNPNFAFAPALTQQHLEPNGKQKMKVRLAAQVLSHSVAAGLYAKVAQNELPQEAAATAGLVADMDKLFDAVNGDTADRKKGKPLLINMSSTSPHLEFFKKMKLFFSEIKFLGARNKPPSQEGWLRTLNAIERIHYNLKKTYNIKSLSTRRLNQDPLENCFGCIRYNCGSNPNPTSVQFVAALKTSIMTNLMMNNKNRNCNDDDNEILNDLKLFITANTKVIGEKDQTTNEVNEPYTSKQSECSVEIDISQNSGEIQACAYVAGFIAKQINNECTLCQEVIFTDPNSEVCHMFTSFREYEDIQQRLEYVKPEFCFLVESAATLINNYLKERSHTEKIKLTLRKICEQINTSCLMGCEVHMEIIKIKTIESVIAICLKRFLTLKNRGFIEEASKQALSRKIKILKNV